MVGLGKLGLPVAVTIALKGHKVLAYDKDEEKMNKYRMGIPDTGSYEPGLNVLLRKALDSGNLMLCDSTTNIWLDRPDIMFVAVPTPSKEDDSFDTSYVTTVLRDIECMPRLVNYTPIIVIISTVLPMTTRTEFAPLTRYPLVYNPLFIAMGTVVSDYLEPEFVLLGYDNTRDNDPVRTMIKFYSSIYEDEKEHPPLLHMTWEEAECTKVLYNTVIGFKIIIGNAIMEMCHNIPYANCDTVVESLKYATKRIIGNKYLKGGMGDGGECHPRDNRALSYLSDKLNLTVNPFDFIMESRDYQCGWLAYLLTQHELPIIILGKRFKANTNLTTDSSSIEVARIAENLGGTVHFHDPVLNIEYYPSTPHVFLAAMDEDWTMTYPYPSGSIVYDVWRRFTPKTIEKLKQIGVTYIAVGKGKVGEKK